MISFWKFLKLRVQLHEGRLSLTCTDCFIALIVRNKMPIPAHQVFHFDCYALGLVSVAHQLFGCSHHTVDALGRDGKLADQ